MRKLLSAAGGLLLALPLDAQAPEARTPLTYRRLSLEAKRLLADKQWDASIPILETLVGEFPEDGAHWRMLAESRTETRRYDEAIRAYAKAIELGFLDQAEGEYQIAASHALRGEPRLALQFLHRSLASRYRWRVRIGSDRRFGALKDDPEFRRLAGLEPPPNDRTRGWIADLDHLVSEIRRVHYRFSREPLPSGFSREVEAARRAIPRTTDAQMVVRLQRLVARLGDGHSLVYPFGMRRGVLPRIPLSFYLFSDGIYVIRAPEELSWMVGARLERLGSLEARRAVEMVGEVASRDNEMGLSWTGPVYLTFPHYLQAIGVTKDVRSVRLAVHPVGSGSIRETVVAAEEPVDPDKIAIKLPPPPGVAPPPLYLSRPDENFWFEGLEHGKTAYVQINQCQNAKNETLDSFALRLRRYLDENEVQNLIVDVRRNNGGEGRLLRELLRTIIRFETGSETRRLYVLIGRTTFSAAQQLVGLLDSLAHPVFVGEPTGSRPKRLGDEAPFLLPFSGVRGSLASGFHQTDSKDDRVWIAPEIPVRLSGSDYFSGRDPVLEVTLAAIAEFQ